MRHSRLRAFVAAFSALWVLTLATAVSAGPDLARLVRSAGGRFLLTETETGSALVKQVMGRAMVTSEEIPLFLRRIEEPSAKRGAELLETELKEIELALQKRVGRNPLNNPEFVLTALERAELRSLSQSRFVYKPQSFGKGAGAASPRSAFLAAVSKQAQAQPAILRYPYGVNRSAHPDWTLSYGFESEYTMRDLEKVVNVYGPEESLGVSIEAWKAMPARDRAAWVQSHLRQLFPSEREPGHLVKIIQGPEYDFLPKRLIKDSTGNVEVVLAPVKSFEAWQRNVNLLNEAMGVGSMQGTVGLPSQAFFGQENRYLADNQGFFNFFNELDTLLKLEVGAARYKKDPSKPVASSFQHSFLGPMTQLKQGKLIEYMEANSQGRLLDKESLEWVAGYDDSFKYVGGTAYRPDIVPGLTIFEVRDTHNNVPALLDRVSRVTFFMQSGRKPFTSMAKMPAFDSAGDYQKLPPEVRTMLEKLFKAKLVPGTEYDPTEQLALEVFRNFSYPMRDWAPLLKSIAPESLAVATRVSAAQEIYSKELERIAAQLSRGEITPAAASLQVQGAVALFAEKSQLATVMRDWLGNAIRGSMGRVKAGPLSTPATSDAPADTRAFEFENSELALPPGLEEEDFFEDEGIRDFFDVLPLQEAV